MPQPTEPLTIRLAVPGDRAALDRLAALDSAPAPKPGAMLVAEIGGDLRAAVPLDGGRAIATPFHPTAELVSLLAARARQLDAGTRQTPRSGRWLGFRSRMTARFAALPGR